MRPVIDGVKVEGATSVRALAQLLNARGMSPIADVIGTQRLRDFLDDHEVTTLAVVYLLTKEVEWPDLRLLTSIPRQSGQHGCHSAGVL
jgi:hypothetical protein